MRRHRLFYPIGLLLLLVAVGCGGGRGRVARPRDTGRATATSPATAVPTVSTAAPLPTAAPTMDGCREWLASSRNLTTTIGCPTWDFFRDELFARGGGVFPVGDDRYYLVWLPEQWETVAARKVIITLHGTGGCAEWMLNQWYQAAAREHPWAIVALQYYDPDTGQYDDDAVIYENLKALWGELSAHCPMAGSDLFYHGFSRGSAQSFPVAIRDRTDARLFAAFIADSGCAGSRYPTLQNQPADALAGARFWLWCGTEDVSTVDATKMTCEVMEEMRRYVEEHGGQVDALGAEEGGGHGMFNDCSGPGDKCVNRKGDNLGPSLPLLFDYIETFAP